METQNNIQTDDLPDFNTSQIDDLPDYNTLVLGGPPPSYPEAIAAALAMESNKKHSESRI